MSPTEARVKKSYYVRVAIVGLLACGPALIMLFQFRGWIKLIALIFMTPPFIMLFQQRRWAKTFDDLGVTRRDGRQLRWHDLKNIKPVHVRLKSGRVYLNHTELIFDGGKAFVFHLMLENAGEVMSLVESLQSRQPTAG